MMRVISSPSISTTGFSTLMRRVVETVGKQSKRQKLFKNSKTNRSKLTIALVDSDGGGGSDRADSVQGVEARQNGGRETDEIAGRHGSVVVVVVVVVAVVDSVLTPRILKEKWRKKPKKRERE